MKQAVIVFLFYLKYASFKFYEIALIVTMVPKSKIVHRCVLCFKPESMLKYISFKWFFVVISNLVRDFQIFHRNKLSHIGLLTFLRVTENSQNCESRFRTCMVEFTHFSFMTPPDEIQRQISMAMFYTYYRVQNKEEKSLW